MFIVAELPTLSNEIIQDIPYHFTKKFQGNAGTLYMRLSEMYLIRAEAYANSNEERFSSAGS